MAGTIRDVRALPVSLALLGLLVLGEQALARRAEEPSAFAPTGEEGTLLGQPMNEARRWCEHHQGRWRERGALGRCEEPRSPETRWIRTATFETCGELLCVSGFVVEPAPSSPGERFMELYMEFSRNYTRYAPEAEQLPEDCTRGGMASLTACMDAGRLELFRAWRVQEGLTLWLGISPSDEGIRVSMVYMANDLLRAALERQRAELCRGALGLLFELECQALSGWE
jgi:hypothetical protein